MIFCKQYVMSSIDNTINETPMYATSTDTMLSATPSRRNETLIYATSTITVLSACIIIMT